MDYTSLIGNPDFLNYNYIISIKLNIVTFNHYLSIKCPKFFIKVFIAVYQIFLLVWRIKMIKRTLIIIIMLAVIIVAAAGSLNSTDSVQESVLGSDKTGKVTKIAYSYKSTNSHKIAVISGMHPRENVSSSVSEDAIKNYARSCNVNIVNYKVEVNENPDYVFSGRKKGETLVVNYVVPDIAKSDYDVVIICHDHKKDYGDGFYVAIPTMDSKSLALAEKFRKISPEYRYYQRDPEKKAQSKSILRVDTPIAKSGTPVFVYEIPEWSKYKEAYDQTYKLIDTAYNIS